MSKTPYTPLEGQFRYPGVKGIEKICHLCYRRYKNCHPDKDCYCACRAGDPVLLVTQHEMLEVTRIVFGWFIQSGKFLIRSPQAGDKDSELRGESLLDAVTPDGPLSSSLQPGA